ncbi:MAG: response regulator [Dehalococcoidales bacterium]|nr:response regulator [Dehalococcoidales bacterium]
MSNDKPHVLVVDDEPPIRRFLRAALQSQGYVLLEATSGQEALSMAVANKPDVIILDLGLPDIDGVEVTRLLREWSQTPIIILSVRGSESDKIAALDAGADDYLTKPFGIGELLARLRAALRRATRVANEPIITIDNLTVDLVKRVVSVAGAGVQLTPNEYDLLRVLAIHAGKVLTHRQLLHEVWGPQYEGESHMLHVNISNLRRKIEPDPARPQLIITEPGVGYRLRVN